MSESSTSEGHLKAAVCLDLQDMWFHVRLRPGMFLGGTNIHCLQLMATEIVRLGLDESTEGFCSNIFLTIRADGSIFLKDDGRACTQAEASHFLTSHEYKGNTTSVSRRLATGFHWLGSYALLSATALSAWMICEIHDGERRWRTRCEAPNNIRPDRWEDVGPCVSGETGISFHFLPDPTIFGDITWDSGRLLRWLWEQVHLYPGLTITFTDEREGCEPQVLCAPGGLSEMLHWGLAEKTPVHSTIISGKGGYEGVQVELALSFIEEEPTWRMYGCGIPLVDGGMPLTGLRTGLSRTLGKLAHRSGISFQSHKARLGIAALVSLWTDKPIFSGPTRQRLANPEAEVAVARVVRDALLTHARQYPEEMQAILAAL